MQSGFYITLHVDSQATFHGILTLAMKNITWRHTVFFISFAILAFLIDRFAKEYITYFLDDRLEIIPNIFSLIVQENPGIAFSIKLPYIIQIILTPALLVFGIKLAFDNLKMDRKFVLVVLGVITGGALSNYVDRILYGGVIDYLSFWNYPVFNIADSFIVVGIFLLVIFYGKIKRVQR